MPETNILLIKLDRFIKKYYTNRLIKGVILFSALFAGVFLAVALLEHYGWYTPAGRIFLFYTWLFLAVAIFIYYILIPAGKLFKFGKVLNFKQAAEIVGRHFPEISDKLLNTLQLMDTSAENELISAAIAQKTNQLTPFAFTTAINFKDNIKYLKYAIWPVLALLVILLTAPSLIIDSSRRIINYNKTFTKPAPFTFNVLNRKLSVNQSENFELEVSVTGELLPNDIYILLDNNKFKLNKKSVSVFTYYFNNVQQQTTFKLFADNFYSNEYQLNVLVKPVLVNYAASLFYPTYLHKKDVVLQNPTDLEIPAGTTVKWHFTAKQTDSILLIFNKYTAQAGKGNFEQFNYTKKFFTSTSYTIKPLNAFSLKVDSLTYQVNVIQDNFPEIEAMQRQDSIYSKLIYLAGNASDDYGLTKLTFNYRFVAGNKTNQPLKSIQIPIDNNKNAQFYYQLSLYEIGFETGDALEYYFEVWDNDGVYKPKSVKSNLFAIKAPDKQEIKNKAEAGSKQFEDKMEQTLKEAIVLQKELNQLQRKLQNNQPINWQEKRKAEELLQRQKELTAKIEELKKDFKKKNIAEQEFNKEDARILEKQMQLEKMYNEILNDEMKKQLQQLEKMMQLQNKDLINKELDKIALNNKEVEKELDRMLELYKQLEVEKKMQHAIDALKDLNKKQQELAQKTEKKELDNEQLKKQQHDLQNEFNELKKDLQKLKEQNKSLENPKDMPNTNEEEKNIDEHMQKSNEDLNKSDNKKAAKEQKQASDELQKMQDKIEKQIEKEEEEQNEEDANTLREILENLIQLSKDQEKIMQDFKQITGYNPQFVEMAQQQKLLKDNAKMVEDSLLALGKRNPQIKSYVNKEVGKMNNHLQNSVKAFSDRNINDIKSNQQYAMASMNNLAVMLSDALKQMQNQSQSNKSGEGKGKKKGNKSGSKPSMGSLKKMQEQLNKQLREGMNKNGSSGKEGTSSEQYARMAAQQMAIRQQMQKILQQMDALEKQQIGGGKQLGELQQLMQQTEKDLVNKKLTQETLMRQQEILTRLLEHEKAEKKQDEENKREAEQAKEYPKPSPKYLDDLSKKQLQQQELLKTVPANMQPYYKEKAKQYLQQGITQ